MEKKKAAKALMVAAALAGGVALGQSFFNEAQATGPTQGGWRFSHCTQFNGKAGGQCLFSTTPNCGLVSLCS
jgi:hypothetical protein